MKVGLMVPQGWKGEYDGWDPATAWARTVELAVRGRGPRLRVALGVRPLPHRARADRRADVRVVQRADRPGDGHRPRPARSHGRLHRVPEPGPHRQDVVDDRRDLRRPVRARDRRRLEGGRVAGLRLRLPDDRRAAGGPARPSRGHRPDVRPGPGDVPRRVRQRRRRDQRAEGPPVAADPDHRRRQRPGRHVPDRRPVRRRAQPRLRRPGPGRRARRRGPRALRGGRSRPGDPARSRCTRATTTSGSRVSRRSTCSARSRTSA